MRKCDKKRVCVYHSRDLDGWMSAAIVKHWYLTTPLDINPHKVETYPEGKMDFVGYDYGLPIPNLVEYDEVILVDISFPYQNMVDLLNTIDTKFLWIDHHISAINEIPDSVNGLRDTQLAACELTWKYFFPNDEMPELVRLLGRYDCFGHKGTPEERKVLEFQFGARQAISNYEDAYRYLTSPTLPNNTELILRKGEAIYSYLVTEAKQIYKNKFEYEYNGKKIGCVNRERWNPLNYGIEYHNDGFDAFMCFHFANGKWNFSIYNDNGNVDVSLIAKSFGGGGHKGASGFVMDTYSFFETFLKFCK